MSNLNTKINTVNKINSLGITSEIVNDIIAYVDNNKKEKIISFLTKNHPADAADLLEMLSEDYRKKVIYILAEKFPEEILPSMNVPILVSIIEYFKLAHLIKMLSILDTDDIIYVLEICDENLRKKILLGMPNNLKKLIKKSLNYAEDSAGRIMQTDYVSVPFNWTIGQVIDYLRRSKAVPDEFYALFAVDSRHVPVGTVPLYTAMRKNREEKIFNIMTTNPKIIRVGDTRQDIAFLFDQYELTSAPVVDQRGRLVGMITIDDVVDLIREKADEDILKLGGVSGEGDLYLAAFKTARSRFGWLGINLLTAIMASIAIAFFETTLEKLVSLAILMPIVASMGGNAGTQTLTVAVRAMATRELTSSNSFRIFGKEILVGLYNGLFFALLIGIITGLWFGDYLLGLIIAFAMLFNLILAGTFGAAIPIILSYFKVDPAVAATVILTTITDILGFVIFLGLAKYLLM
ncbi:MAG: Magnesium transporter MgtE [Alphaproteobacteria bacterium MarineAlpha9_Bin4]|nr:magnesium transporter [Pelagibacterales bacterium]PPR27117.1 MAG: Magnesium transporter MgtE [Alphaproteobacteria bacterium MarineAlpha9_Bin4]